METISHYIGLHAKNRPDSPAVITSEGMTTWAEFWQMVQDEAECQSKTIPVAPAFSDLPECTQDLLYLVKYHARHIVGEADILYTTGSEGKPKGVMMSHRAMLADAENLIRAHGYHKDLTFVICGPLNHFGCHSKVLAATVSGAALYIMPDMKDVNALLDVMGHFQHSASFLVPSALRMIMQLNAARLSSLDGHIEFIETGAAPITIADMERLRTLLPSARLYNTYASTETGVTCTYPFHLKDMPLRQGCVGRPFHLSQVSVREGVVVVSGPQIMSGYVTDGSLADFNNESHSLNNIPQTESLSEIVTSDLGEFASDGSLILTGRAGDIINVGGLKVSPVEVEEAAMSLPQIQDCLCKGVAHPLMGQVPKLLVVLAEGFAFSKRDIARALKSILKDDYKVPLQYEQVDAIPYTFNGKKNRKL